MPKQPVVSKLAPAAIGPYSQATRAGDLLFVSGQLPLDPLTGVLEGGDPESQIRRCFQNIEAILRAAGGELHHVVKVTVYLVDLDHFSQLNKVMAEVFDDPFPARVTLGVAALPKEATVEVEAVAALDG